MVLGCVIIMLPRWGASLSFLLPCWLFSVCTVGVGGSYPLRGTGHTGGFAMNLAGTCVPVSCRIQDNAFPFFLGSSVSLSPNKGVGGGYSCARYCAECHWVLPPTPIIV